mmetsp:Transcript_39057/g.91380  ORF Transcript_39057/g.91380 Transcript_39057/m.91380 type:complete len:116 (-) Transcript_39057:278-625(-)
MESSGSTVTEGIGIGRITANFKKARLDGAIQGTDAEAINMAHYLLRNEGLFVGPSTGLNCVGAVKMARKMGPGSTIVTILCDSGERYQTKVFNTAFLEQHGLALSLDGQSLNFVS